MATPTVCFVTLGCAKNEVDTRDMKRSLEGAGFGIVEHASDSDVVVVNTCSFIRPATEESIDAILDIAGMDGVKEGRTRIIVAGCLPARYGDELESELTEAAAFVPCSKEDDIVEVVKECLGIAGVPGELVPSCSQSVCPEGAFAYVKISDGCDRYCSYCTIPYIRGRYHSFSLDEIRAEVESLVESGVQEIVLIGQDTGLWGSDFEPKLALSDLLDALASEFEGTWFRVLYTQPESVDDRLLLTIAAHSNIAPYLDVPMQHCSPRVLSLMNRKGSGDGFLDLCERARKTVPDIALRTTLIAGFPGETEEEFEELVGFVEEACFDYVGVFAYSQEDGTRAAGLDGQLDDDEKAYRAERLRSVADAVSASVIAARCGRIYPAIVEGVEEDGQVFGRSMVQAPEVDGVTYMSEGDPGEFVTCAIEDTFLYDMEGTTL